MPHEPFVVAALIAFAVLGVALSVVDLREHRLPDRLLLPGYPIALVLLGAASLAAGTGWPLVRAIAAGGALFAFYLALRLASPSSMGGGDVKLAGLVGLHTGWFGWDAFLIGAVAAFVLGGIAGIALLLARRARRTTPIPFGPFMLAGAWVGIALG